MTELMGCRWEVGKTRRWDGRSKRYQLVPVHCNKMVASQSEYCPRHKAIAEHVEPKSPQQYSEGR